MKLVTFTEFRKRASSLITEVEQGEVLLVIRHGRPVAEVVPYTGRHKEKPAWKRPGLRLETQGASLSEAILEEREAHQ